MYSYIYIHICRPVAYIYIHIYRPVASLGIRLGAVFSNNNCVISDLNIDNNDNNDSNIN
jgi:hypothetical protein